MPHCIVEHSSNLEPQPILTAVFQGACESELFEASDIKVRSSSFEHYQTGNVQSTFIHIVLKILDGRTIEQKAKLSELVLAKLLELAIDGASFTVEVVDIERASYAKRVRS